jgi:hypothetical protein
VCFAFANSATSIQGIGVAHIAMNPHRAHVFAASSYGGWCAVIGAEPSPQIYECLDIHDLYSSAVLVARWNPCVPNLLGDSNLYPPTELTESYCCSFCRGRTRSPGGGTRGGHHHASSSGGAFGWSLSHHWPGLVQQVRVKERKGGRLISFCSSARSSSGVTLFVAADDAIVELRVNPANLSLKNLASLVAE